MINGKKVIAIIPARGGSKRLPKKNILPLNGKPLIGWSIDEAKNSQYIDEIFVSTDDPAIADISESYDISIPELRPDELSSDNARTDDVLTYTLGKFGEGFDIVILLQPSSPLRTSKHIDEALELFIEKKAISVVSVTNCEHPPQWTNILPENGSLFDFIKPENIKRSQDLDTYYRLNGAVYIYDINEFSNNEAIIFSEGSYAYVMDNKSSIDIDTAFDFEMAKFVFSIR